MIPTPDQLARIKILAFLNPEELARLQSDAEIQRYQLGEIVMGEGDRLPARLFAVLDGTIRISKTAETGKETILRFLSDGEIFAAPALLGNGIAPATVTAETNCQILTLKREALLNAIQQTPEIALRMMMVLNQRLQQLHETVHGLASERALTRLVRLIQYYGAVQGWDTDSNGGQHLKMRLSYYQIARSIGITYEECVRLFKQLQPAISYHRGGKITVHDWDTLESIASGTGSVEH